METEQLNLESRLFILDLILGQTILHSFLSDYLKVETNSIHHTASHELNFNPDRVVHQGPSDVQ